MGVAGLQVGPGVDDRDHRLALPLLGRVAHLHGARAVAERAQVGRAEPAGGAQLGRRLARGLRLRGGTGIVWHVGILRWSAAIVSLLDCAYASAFMRPTS